VLDLSKLTESVTSLFGGGASDALQGGMMDLLQNAGIDPGMLEGLSQTQIADLLSQYGIDPSQLGADQLGELMQNFGGEQLTQLTQVASDWFGGGDNKS
jgi:hypothetical protein